MTSRWISFIPYLPIRGWSVILANGRVNRILRAAGASDKERSVGGWDKGLCGLGPPIGLCGVVVLPQGGFRRSCLPGWNRNLMLVLA